MSKAKAKPMVKRGATQRITAKPTESKVTITIETHGRPTLTVSHIASQWDLEAHHGNVMVDDGLYGLTLTTSGAEEITRTM